MLDNKAYALILDSVLRSRSIKKVIWGASWVGYTPSDLNAEFGQRVRALADAIMGSGKQFYITADVPHFRFDPKKCAAQRPLFRSINDCSIPTEVEAFQSRDYLARLSDIAATDPRIELIRLDEYFCDKRRCSMLADDHVVYRDSNHLNIIGSKLVGEAIVRDHPSIGFNN